MINITRTSHLKLIFGVIFFLSQIKFPSCSAEIEKLSWGAVEKSSLKREDEAFFRVPGIGRARHAGNYDREVLRSGRPIFVAPPTFGKMELHRPIVLNHRYRHAYG